MSEHDYRHDWQAWAIPLGLGLVFIGIIICLCGACGAFDDDDDNNKKCTTSQCRKVDDSDALKLKSGRY